MHEEYEEMVSKISEHVKNVPRTISMLIRGGEAKQKQAAAATHVFAVTSISSVVSLPIVR